MRKAFVFLAVALAAMMLVGCGTPMYELTDDEEELIVQTAAYIVSKHNIYQKDGMNGTQPETEEETEEETEISEEETEEDTEDGDNAISGGGSGGTTDSDTSSGGEISLSEAFGHDGVLDVSYVDSSLMDKYFEGTYFSLTADEGDTFVVMYFTIENPGDEDIEVDNFLLGNSFYLSFGSVSHISEKSSFMADDLSTYEGTVAAGGSEDAVLIFEITKDQAEEFASPTLTMEQDGVSYSVALK